MVFSRVTAIFVVLAGVAGPLRAQGTSLSYTLPGGFVAESLEVGFNLVGITMHSPRAAMGTMESAAGTTLTDNEVDFDATLGTPGGTVYLLRILNGAVAGTVIEITSWSGNDLTGIVGLSPEFAADYEIRKAPTLEELFADTLASFLTPGRSDIVWLPNPAGTYDRYYKKTPFFGDPEWIALDPFGGESPAGDVYVNYIDAFFVEIKEVPKPWHLFGELITTSVVVPFPVEAFIPVSAVYPSGTTLANLGFESFFDSFLTVGSSDNLWQLDAGTGTWNRYFFKTPFFGDPGWIAIAPDGTETPIADPTTVVVNSGFFIEKKSPENGLLTAPNYNLE